MTNPNQMRKVVLCVCSKTADETSILIFLPQPYLPIRLRLIFSFFIMQEEVGNVSRYAYTVGQDNFYLLYEVMVQAYNVEEGTGEKRYGPTSPIGYAYSAEGSKLASRISRFLHNT